jgi:GTP pyrophosphokinase
MPKVEDFLAAIGYGKIPARQALDKVAPGGQFEEKPAGGLVSAVKRAFAGDGDRIKVRGADDMLVFRAKCCNPIRGEKIVGYITRGKGVSVHSVECPNVATLLYDPDRRIDVEWDRAGDEARYTVRLTMEVEDRKGLLADVSAKIAGVNTNITSFEARTDESEPARINMTVEISDLKHLEKVIRTLQKVEGVRTIERLSKQDAGR